LYLISPNKTEDGLINGSEYLNVLDKIYSAIGDKKIISAYALGMGGICEAIAKMSFGNTVGAKIENLSADEFFEKNYGAIVVEATSALDFGKEIGTTLADPIIEALGEKFEINQLYDLWNGVLLSVYGMDSTQGSDDVEIIENNKKFTGSMVNLGAKPRVLIPVFPGTNSEYDTQLAFNAAGADAKLCLVRNLNSQMLNDSTELIAKEIKNSQIIVFPGGFSGGDEPDGSGKFMTAVFAGGKVREAMDEFVTEDKLILGICNGFQALVKLGLLPYGKITKVTEESPTLTFNTIARHQAKLVDVRLSTVNSPWLMGDSVGDIYTVPISHGEGKFVAPDEVIRELIKKGQIASQYVNPQGVPTMDIRYNPAGSLYGIESVISENGKIYGKMGHNERLGSSLYKNGNIKGNMQIFNNAVKYFKG
ncbi:MAG: phosphoribosylformylglycinamidine synthase subunit PurQ, partial [Oscillospiraceae bacterium]